METYHNHTCTFRIEYCLRWWHCENWRFCPTYL